MRLPNLQPVNDAVRSSLPPRVPGGSLLPAWFWVLPALWTLIVALGLGWNMRHIHLTVQELAEVAARSNFEKDILYRKWATMHGGVYVPVSDKTPPNPYLSNVVERDITTPSGRPLTLINPAYMTRQVHAMGEGLYGHPGRITSLKPIRPENAPDAWERQALESLQGGAEEVISRELIKGEPHLRLMRPMKTEAGCLKCHAAQGYREGDIRGGLSVAVPLKDYTAIVRPHQRQEWLAYGSIWALGLVWFGIAGKQFRQRRQAVRALTHSHDLMRYIIEHSRSAIAVHDRDLKYIYVSQRYLAEYGVKERDVIGKHHYEVFPDLPQKWREVHQKALHGVISSADNDSYERDDGTVDWTRWECRPWYEANGSIGGIIIYTEVITERKLLEEQLRQAQKLESIGQLAGGVAHDFNNILAAMMMRLSLLRENPELDAETRDSLEELMVEAQRAGSLTRQLLMFSRRSVLEIKVIDLHELIANLLKMLRRLIGENVSLRFESQARLPLVEADPGMIEQVLVNLAVNARDAMPKGGHLTIRLEPAQVGPEQIKGNPPVPPGAFFCLSVADDGCGMDSATLKRIFDPFFTTKEPGKGTGLGLATVYGIVAQHQGWVEVESKPGLGSLFKVFLPATTKLQPAPLDVQTGTPPLLRGHETILLVEDEVNVRRGVAQGLRRLGYQVLEADHGQTALQVWRQHAGQIDLLFSDMVMPEGLTGLDLAEKFRQEKPSLKVIISSGYSTEQVEPAEPGKPAPAGLTCLRKPYQLETLSKIVRESLDSEN